LQELTKKRAEEEAKLKLQLEQEELEKAMNEAKAAEEA
jgi:hypothetical protein